MGRRASQGYPPAVRQRPPSSRPTSPFPLIALLLLGVLAACGPSGGGPRASSDALPTGLVGPVPPTVGPEALRYVALGDPYTFGDGVRQMDRWPNQLVRILRPALDLDLIVNLAGRSIASRDVIDEQLPDLRELEPQFVTLQVGANDVCFYREGTPDAYRSNIAEILDGVLALVDADRVVALTAPDFTLMPVQTGSCAGELEEQAARIRELNGILMEVAGARGVPVVDVSPIANRVTSDPSLVGADGIHPSAKQYAGWADLVALTVRELFREPVGSPDASPSDASRSP